MAIGKMKTILCFMVMCAVLRIVDVASWPSRDGCNVELDLPNCFMNVYCLNYVNVGLGRFIRGYSQDLEVYFKSCDGIPWHGDVITKINMFITVNSLANAIQIPKFSSGYCGDNNFPIVNLNAADNKYFLIYPDICNTPHLKYLNLSHNHFGIARLYNTFELKYLQEIDLSYNSIYDIDVDGEYKYENLTKLLLSHNSITKIPDTLYAFRKLETLDLSYNRIKKLNMYTFDGIKYMTHLNLSNNEITDITASLFRFNELKVLDLSHNEITAILISDLNVLKNLEILDLSHNSIKSIESNLVSTMTNLNTFAVRSNMIELIDNKMFLNNIVLEHVDFADNKLKAIPKELFKNQNISYFNIERNSLEGPLARGMFVGLGLVTKLDLSSQNLTTVEDYTFFDLKNITNLLLNNNNIELLTKKSFKSLHNLMELDLSNNKITSIDFEMDDLISLQFLLLENNFITHVKSECFRQLIGLRVLDLSYNKITALEPNAFKSLLDLFSLNIHNNPLNGSVEGGTFDGLNSLPSLDISGTQFTNIKNDSFRNMARLKFLNISHSQVRELEYDAFAHTGAIASIDLSFNKLDTFNVNPKSLLNVTKLLLNNNNIKQINSNQFNGLSQLMTVNLANNDIVEIQNDAFHELKHMDRIDLSYNKKMLFNMSLIEKNRNLINLVLSGTKPGTVFLETIYTPLSELEMSNCDITDVSALNLKALPRLKYLHMKENKIQMLTTNDFSKLDKLEYLDLSFNKINVIQPGVFKENFQLNSLNISHNELSVLSYGIFRGLPNLYYLDISFNNIDDIKSERFNELRNLRELIVDSNKIETFNALLFNGGNLKKLSIGDNHIPCETLINLDKMSLSFMITSIHKIENNVENHNGITCNKKRTHTTSRQDYDTLSENGKSLLEIRDILEKNAIELKNQTYSVNITTDDDNTKNVPKITGQIDKLSTKYDEKLSLIAKGSNDTNILLGKILKVLNIANTIRTHTTPISFTKDNISLEKQDLENVITLEKETILADVDKKTINHIESNTYVPVIDDLHKDEDVHQTSIFTETCVALNLIILVCYMFIKFYKSQMWLRPRRSYSTRELPSSMESPINL